MKISYYPETDSVYIALSDRPGADVVQVSDDVVVDVDEKGAPVGIDVSAGASEIANLSEFLLERVVEGDKTSIKFETSFLTKATASAKEKSVG
jgi:uncharacterized protein YuzE